MKSIGVTLEGTGWKITGNFFIGNYNIGILHAKKLILLLVYQHDVNLPLSSFVERNIFKKILIGPKIKNYLQINKN